MGLDMYAYALNRTPEKPVDFKADDAVEIHYWRKHPNLHGWMERRYREKGGAELDFNCVNVQLTSADLDALADAIRSLSLPPTNGFFFGASDGSEIDDDLQFVAKAREALAAGLTVFYSSWW
ncbi:phosphoglycerate kinase [Bradyrhizobium sp. CCBAU 53421]|nr:phosphoglycerate kinase [Bradyrhizobium sp. CCBAU 53421]